MVKYVRFSFIIFLILAIFQLKRLFIHTQNSKRKVSLCIFLIPLFLGIYVNPQGLNAEIASKRSVLAVENSSSKKNSKINTQPQVSTPLKDNTLVIDGNNCTHIVDDICYNNSDKYKDKKVAITGFVYKNDTNSKNEFLISRLMMVCCAADTEITGLLCHSDRATTLKNSEWVKITGTIDIKTLNDNGEKSSTPIIKVENIEPAKQPKNQYIYPE